MFFGDQVDRCYRCPVRQGQTLFIPTGIGFWDLKCDFFKMPLPSPLPLQLWGLCSSSIQMQLLPCSLPCHTVVQFRAGEGPFTSSTSIWQNSKCLLVFLSCSSSSQLWPCPLLVSNKELWEAIPQPMWLPPYLSPLRLDPCCADPSWLPGVWGQLPPQSQHWDATQVSVAGKGLGVLQSMVENLGALVRSGLGKKPMSKHRVQNGILSWIKDCISHDLCDELLNLASSEFLSLKAQLSSPYACEYLLERAWPEFEKLVELLRKISRGWEAVASCIAVCFFLQLLDTDHNEVASKEGNVTKFTEYIFKP